MTTNEAKERKRAYYKAWCEKNKAKKRAYDKQYYLDHKDETKEQRAEYSKAWFENNPDKVREYNAKRQEAKLEWARENKDKVAASRKRNAHKHKGYWAKYARNRRATDPLYALASRIRKRIAMALKSQNIAKTNRTHELIGCSIPELKAHLERQFAPGMTWENHGKGQGKWHIDHIRPIISFDLSDESQRLECFHFTNMQPLWQQDNLSKGGSYNTSVASTTVSI